MEDRFTLPAFQRGSVVCTFGILPDPNPISAARSPEPGQLAQALMHQVCAALGHDGAQAMPDS
eukprot:1885076-Rhodomonas_salina.3